MSMTSCEIASSQRSASGGDFQCTSEELYESFMEIVTNQENQSVNNYLETSSIEATDKNLIENTNIMRNDNMSTDVINRQCHEPEDDVIEGKIEPIELSADWIDTDSQAHSDVKIPENNDMNMVNESIVHCLNQSDISPSKSALLLGINETNCSSQNSSEETNNIFCGKHLTEGVFHKEISSNSTVEGKTSLNNNIDQLSELNEICDRFVPSQKEKQEANTQESDLQQHEPHNINSQETDQQGTELKVSQGTEPQVLNIEETDSQVVNIEESEPEVLNVEETDSQVISIEETEPKALNIEETELQEKDHSVVNPHKVVSHSIEEDIEEGIRKASQVCDEINEFINLNRMSMCSDGFLDDNDNANIDSETGLKNGNENIENNKMGNSEAEPQISIAIKISSDDSSSTCSSLQEGSQHSTDELDEHKKSVSLSSNEDTLGDAKSTGMSSSSQKSPVDWEILNTAFGSGETDDDEGEVYETSHNYGGFGLMLDDDDAPQRESLLHVDNRVRSVSQSSTVSECEFQQEYKKQHSVGSLERKKDGVLHSGYLNKLGGTGITPKNWRKRWCVLRHDHCLYYYKTAKDKVPCGIVVLNNYTVSRGSEFHKKHCLKLSKGGGRTYFFCSEAAKDMLKWMDALRKAANVIDEGTNFEIREEIIHNVAIPALSIKKPDCHGYLTKQGGKNRNSWRRRYCVLKTGCLYYYREMADTTALGVAKLHGYTLEEVTFPGKRTGFRALPPAPGMRTFSFIADNDYDRKRWIPCLNRSIQEANTFS